MKKAFRLDRSNGKFLGVCAGLANSTGLDANIIRIGLVVATFVFGTPLFCIAYFVLAWVGDKAGRRTAGRFEEARPTMSVSDLKAQPSGIDDRLAEIDRYVASPNVRLAREIEELR